MKKEKVAIQGIRASFHEEAALKFFGDEIQTLECQSFRQTCQAVVDGSADYAVLAIENSIAGSLLPNYSLITDNGLQVVGEIYLPIRLHLLALPGVNFEQVKYVESHPIAIRQCVDFFDEFPHLQVIESHDTAACAKKISEQQLTDTVAIANQLAAQVYGLQILERRIESHKKNYTRFLVLKNGYEEIAQADKASLSFQVGNAVGSLARVLDVLAEAGINLSKIQSMPVLGRRNEYNFYVDIEYPNKEAFQLAVPQLLRYTRSFSMMGQYKKNDQV